MEGRCSQPEEGQRLLSAPQSTCGNNQARGKALASRVLAAAFGQGGRRDRHLLEVEESLVGAESRCQRGDPSAADGVALETETNGRRHEDGTGLASQVGCGVVFGAKSICLPVSLRNGHLPATGDSGEPRLKDQRGEQPGQHLLLAMAAPAPPSRGDGACRHFGTAMSWAGCHRGCWLSWGRGSCSLWVPVTPWEASDGPRAQQPVPRSHQPPAVAGWEEGSSLAAVPKGDEGCSIPPWLCQALLPSSVANSHHI